MFFGIGPFGVGLGFGNQQPQQQQQQHFFPQQGQPGFRPNPNQPNQQPPNNGGLFGGFFDNFMHPFFQGNNPNQNRNQPPQQQETRPSYYRKGKEENPKESQPAQKTEFVNQNSGFFWKTKGNEAFQKGRYEEAIQLYTKAIEMNNTESVYFSNRAQAEKKMGMIEQALKDAQQSVELDTSNARGHIIAGQCLAEIGKREENPKKLQSAITRLTKALTLSFGKRTEIQKEASRFIYLVKKVLFYIRFNQIRNARLEALKEYRVYALSMQDYLEKDEKLDNETKEKKMQDFVKASDEQIVFSIPDYLQCKITFDLMEDPVVTDSGQCYERLAIEEHMQKNGRTDPFTRQPIKGPLYPCITIKKAVQQFLERNPWAYEYSEGQNYKDIQF